MRFEWDRRENRQNRAKHGISFETAQLVFKDPHALSIQDRHDNGEERWQTIGHVAQAVILLVAHTFSDEEDAEEVVRIISARKATPRERKVYEQTDR
jgi:hypothetical protein